MAYVSNIRANHHAGRGFFKAIGERFAQYKVYHRTLRELAELSDRDLADLGLNRAIIHKIAHEAAYGK